jgi:hypothetical protein
MNMVSYLSRVVNPCFKYCGNDKLLLQIEFTGVILWHNTPYFLTRHPRFIRQKVHLFA